MTNVKAAAPLSADELRWAAVTLDIALHGDYGFARMAMNRLRRLAQKRYVDGKYLVNMKSDNCPARRAWELWMRAVILDDFDLHEDKKVLEALFVMVTPHPDHIAQLERIEARIDDFAEQTDFKNKR